MVKNILSVIFTVLGAVIAVLGFFIFRRKKVVGEVQNMDLDLDFIKRFETGDGKPILTVFRNKMDGNLEVGYGHVLPPFWKVGQEITECEAELFFQHDVEKAVAVYGDSIPWDKMTKNQCAAIISHAYNTGAKSATIVEYVNEGRWSELAEWFPKHYITSKGVEYPGLVKRRQYEAQLLMK